MAEDAEELDGTEPKKKSKKGLLFGAYKFMLTS